MKVFEVTIEVKTESGTIRSNVTLLGNSKEDVYERLKKSFGADLIYVQFLQENDI